MVIVVTSLVPACDTYEQGEILRDEMLAALLKQEKISVSFEGVSYVTSSFVNAAFVGLLDAYDLDQIKSRLAVVRSHRQINDLVRMLVTHSAPILREHIA